MKKQKWIVLLMFALSRLLFGQEIEIDSTAEPELAPFEKMPVLKEFIKADYPAEELKKGVEGKVLFELFITDSGRVDSITVLQGLNPSMDSAALHAVRRFQYEPAIAGGVAVPVLLQYEYRFSVQDEIKELEKYVNLKGRLIERGTRSPIPFATIVAAFPDTTRDTTLRVPWTVYLQKIGGFEGQFYEAGAIVTQTDSLGRFAFQSLPAGIIKLSFPVSGYRADSIIEAVEKGALTENEYRLEKLNYNEYEIVVYGTVEKEEVAKTQLTLTEIKRIPGFGGDAVKVVQALPGVARSSFNGGEIVVRGSGTGDTRYFLDGMELPVLFHFGGLKSTYNSDALSSVDLYPGGFNSRYGNTVGGVVEIKGRPAKTDRWHGNVDINLIDASFLAEGPINEEFALLVTARRSYIADVLNWGLKQAGIILPMTVVPYYWDIVARLDYKPSRDCRMFLTGFAFTDQMKFVFSEVRGGSTEVSEAKDEISQSVDFQTLIYGWDQHINKSMDNEFRLQWGNAPTSFNIFSFAKGDFIQYGGYLRDEWAWQIREKLKLNSGLDMALYRVDYTLDILSADGARQSKRDLYVSDLAGYVNAEYKPVKSLLLVPGLRYDYYTELSEGRLSPRVTSRFNWKKGHTLKGALGMYNQSPEPYGQAIDSVWGNPELPATLGKQAVLGYEYQLTDLIGLDVQTYYNTQKNIPAQSDSFNSSGNPVNYLPDQEGRMYGFELMLRHSQSEHFFGWISYSLSRSERRSPRRMDEEAQAGSAWDPDKWYLYGKDQTHNLQFVGSWRLPRNWEVGGRLRYVTGNPYTPYLSYTEHQYFYDAENGRYRPVLGEYLSDRMGAFVQLDVRVDKKFIYEKWILSAYLDVQNVNYPIYNSPETYDYNYDYSDRQVIGGIIIPSLGVKAEF
ncbi:MAG: hypothetical protein A2293_12980 [Elusimicrobia bacterium RIFOXYB2_FULL_49_7]|nr:MAG: hypothetical protein A2293_12980 [Elusimicrobia bacterium RIFOXYB2_FULL_49_7]